jgi:hypothetical protein
MVGPGQIVRASVKWERGGVSPLGLNVLYSPFRDVTPNSSCSGVVDCATFVGGRTGIVAGAASLEIQISLDSTAITYQLVDGYIGGS